MPQPVPLLLVGPPQVLVQNTIYAMPACLCRAYVSPGAATFEGNSINSATGMAAITLTAGEFTTAAPFVRMTSATGTVTLKPAVV